MHCSPRLLAESVHAFLVDLDPARTRTVTEEHRLHTLTQARAQADGVVSAWKSVEPPLQADASLHQATAQLQHALHHGPTPSQGGQWLDLRDHVSPFYEALVTALRRHGERVPTLHPTNHARTVFHVMSGVTVVAAFEKVLTPTSAVVVAGVFCVLAWTTETVRRFVPSVNVLMMRLFKPVARDHERYRINSTTWYGTAMLLIAITAPNEAGMLGIMALALGDPAAGWVGRRFGRFRVVGGKSVEGTLAFALTAMAGGLVYLTVATPHAVLGMSWWMLPAVAACVGALTELFATRVDDNLAVPVFSAWATLLAQRLVA